MKLLENNKKKTKKGMFQLSACALAIIAMSGPAHAVRINTGNPDLAVRWDNTLRYNLGVRAEKADKRIANNPSFDESNNRFDRGDVVTNRLDLLSEFDVVYKRRYGARVSAATWYDFAYRDTDTDPSDGQACNYDNCKLNGHATRFHRGLSGEVLDAFVFAGFDIGSSILNVKAGQHTVYWGEGLLIGPHAISYSQAPQDGLKALSSPGIETKEVFLPINQLSAQLQLNPQLSFSAQYYLDWKPTRTPSGGSYLANNDILNSDFLLADLGAGPQAIARRSRDGELDTDGSFGVNMRWSIPNSDAVLGVYYRKFDDFNPWSLRVTEPTPIGFDPVLGQPVLDLGTYSFGYAENVELYGLSYATVLNSISTSVELSYRKDTALNTGALDNDFKGAKGNTWHFVLTGMYGLTKTSFWDTGSVAAEFAYNRLDKVTGNEHLFKSEGYDGCPDGQSRSWGCSTRDYTGMAVNFTPQYLQVWPGVDLNLPLTMTYGINGVSPNASGGNEGEYTWSAGAQLNIYNTHEVTLRYQDRKTKTKYEDGLAIGGTSSNYSLNDRGYVSLTYKTSF